jgi:hypothetical protein
MSKILTMLLSLLLLTGMPARAAWEVGLGHADEVLDETSSTAHVAYVQTGGRFEHVYTLAYVPGRESRESGRISPGTAVLLYTTRFSWRQFYFGSGFGVASKKDSQALSSYYQFTQALGWKISPNWIFEFRHISNAGFEGRNIGENLITLSYRFD